MITVLLILIALNTLLGILVLLFVLFRQRGDAELKQALSALSIHLENATSGTRDDLQRTRSELLNQQSELRTELTAMLTLQKDSIAQESRNSREETSASLDKLNQQTNADAAKNREELGRSLDSLSESMSRKLQELTGTQQSEFEALKTALEQKMEQIRSNNETKLEQMRKTVDEKLHDTLEKRLGESFKQVSERLELVHSGLGEMQNLASGWRSEEGTHQCQNPGRDGRDPARNAYGTEACAGTVCEEFQAEQAARRGGRVRGAPAWTG